MTGEMPRRGGLPARRVTSRAIAVAVATVVLTGAMLMEAGVASAATVVQGWQTRVGGGLTDTSTLTAYSTGSGILRIRATKLRTGATFGVTVYKGNCGWIVPALGPALFSLPSVTSSSSGAITRNPTLSATRVKQVRAAWNAGAGVALVFRRGSSLWCGEFAALGRRGQTVRLENAQYQVVTRAERWAGTGGTQPEAGGAYVTVYVRIKALKKTSYNDRSYTLRDSTGTDWQQPIVMWGEREPALGSGDLLAGQTVEGWVTSIAPEAQLDSLTLVYWMNWSGYIMLHESPTLLVPLGTLAQPTPSPTPSPAASSSPSATPGLEPTPTPGI
jgi:hypothetical protein